MKNEDLSAFVDRLEILQGKRVKLIAVGPESKKAIYWIKQSLGENLRTFKYHGRTKASPGYAVVSFSDRESFDQLLESAKKIGEIVLSEFR